MANVTAHWAKVSSDNPKLIETALGGTGASQTRLKLDKDLHELADLAKNVSESYRDFFIYKKESKQEYCKLFKKLNEMDAKKYFDVPFLVSKLGEAPVGNKRQDIEDALTKYVDGLLVNKDFLYLYTEGIPPVAEDDPNKVEKEAFITNAYMLDKVRQTGIFKSKDVYKRCKSLQSKSASKQPISVEGGTLCCQKPDRVCVGTQNLGCIESNGHCTVITNYCTAPGMKQPLNQECAEHKEGKRKPK